jgi:nitroreductase
MELREVIGRRRSIRFLLPHKPVELDKIQRMLEAARIASHWGNVNSLRAVVIERDKAPKDLFEILSNTVGGYQSQLAPVVIVWYIETAATDQIGTRLRELVEIGAIGYGPNKKAAMEKTIIPNMERAGVALKLPGMGEIDCGQGIAQATLMAFEQGLGTCCLGSHDLDKIRRTLGLPDTCRVLLSQTVGYPAEDPRAGGQRPRLPFETLYQLNGYDNPFPRNPQVVQELERDGMLQDSAPLPWRQAELDYLKRALNLKGEGLVPSDQRAAQTEK